MLKISAGSVKDLYVGDIEDEIHFLFSDRVSVFDFGALPEKIPGRGQALCQFAKLLFTDLQLPSAYLGNSILGGAGMKMQMAAHPKFKLKNEKLKFVPLEVIFRWGVPEGSRLLKKGYKAFETFSAPKIEYTTKLEAFDRDLTTEEAQELLPPELSLEQLRTFTADVALKLKNYFHGCGLQLWDGKIEVAVDQDGKLLLIDAITPDELRLTMADFPRIPLSKEILRRWYQKTLWPAQLQSLKEEKGQSWKESAPPPPALGTWRKNKLAELFTALTQVVREKNPQALELWIKNEEAPKVFVAGSGGRETALRWKLKQEGCQVMAQADGVDAVLVSNDNDLAAGLIDQLASEQKWAVGPTRSAAHVEWSKIFGKEIARDAKIPMAAWTTNPAEALTFPKLPVIKQDGLAGGKGVALPDSREEFDKIVKEWSTTPLLFEERLSGEEASLFFWIHPQGNDFTVQFLGSAQDFKRRFDGDQGPNTGGMGALSPHPNFTEAEVEMARTWTVDTARALKQRGILYSGPLFLGLLRDQAKGWCLLEYNARFGDPETEALVLRWQNPLFLRSQLALTLSENLEPELSDDRSLCLALVHPQYPTKGESIELSPWEIADKETQIFLTGSKAGRLAYLCLRGKSHLGERAAALMADSPWAKSVEWRKDPLR